MRVALGLVVLCCLARTSPAQLRDPSPGTDWIDVAYPKLFYASPDGLTVGGYYAWILPLGFADYDLPPAYRASLALNGQLSTSGSRGIAFDARLPELFRGWRLVGSFSARRRARESYYGIGNDTQFDEANVTDTQEHFYQSLNVRLTVRGEIQRRVLGGLRVLAGFHAERWRIDTLPGPSQLGRDAAAGLDPAIGAATTDVAFRTGVVLDTRDSEPAPRRGVLIELIHAVADPDIAGDVDYTRTTATVAGHLPIGQRLVIATRVVGQRMGGTPRLGSYSLVEASDRPYEGLGGANSHRALFENRLLGRHKLFGNLDVRYDVFAVPTLIRLTAVGFVDAGRVLEGTDFTLTTDGMKVGGGAGLVLQFGRAGILGLTFGQGPDGMAVHAHTRWSY